MPHLLYHVISAQLTVYPQDHLVVEPPMLSVGKVLHPLTMIYRNVSGFSAESTQQCQRALIYVGFDFVLKACFGATRIKPCLLF